ncbi:MAG: hypothetical protein ACK4RK_17055 [Gemmataceae bacterium]
MSWLEQRLKHKGKKEIENMLLGELADLRETQSGKELIQIGREEGKIEGEQEALIWAMETKFGSLTPAIRERVAQVKSVDQLKDLLRQVLKADTLEQLQW